MKNTRMKTAISIVLALSIMLTLVAPALAQARPIRAKAPEGYMWVAIRCPASWGTGCVRYVLRPIPRKFGT